MIDTKRQDLLNQDKLKHLLKYDEDTGDFIRLTRAAMCVQIGDVAGYLHKVSGYVIIRINFTKYCAHRLAWLYMTGVWPKDQVDHINHIRSDNRWLNLREATCQENGRNRAKNKDNTSGVTGVCWARAHQQWKAYITVSCKPKHLGFFADKFEAICCRKSAESKYGFHPNHGAR